VITYNIKSINILFSKFHLRSLNIITLIKLQEKYKFLKAFELSKQKLHPQDDSQQNKKRKITSSIKEQTPEGFPYETSSSLWSNEDTFQLSPEGESQAKKLVFLTEKLNKLKTMSQYDVTSRTNLPSTRQLFTMVPTGVTNK
jgi:lipopolysaccharide export LptBFGC system permease protein LptF